MSQQAAGEMAMFPLGAVLFPHLPLHLRVFEERYLVMLSRLLESDTAEFGVVLIERGQEVGGGEHRFRVGTVAQITELGVQHGHVALVAQGERRLEVTDWLTEDPHPRAEVRFLPDLEWDPSLQPLWQQAEQLVRRTLAQASEFTEQQWPADVELSQDRVAASWQLAGIAPVGPLDQITLLRATSIEELLTLLIDVTAAAAEPFSAPWPE
ncbi:MAG TPA: LON peptidase substrate-binding domain-containing protein [Propionibacteriaceae bacterium]|nr:LON peptidase substrate-binding domain-containing protein [Propionibacteriaceae bacterium]